MRDTPSTIVSNHRIVVNPQAISLGQTVFTLQVYNQTYGIDFVYPVRIQSLNYVHTPRTYGCLNSGRCECGKGSTDYPHWPPNTINEAFDRLKYLHDKHNRHRPYLVQQWSYERAREMARLVVIST